MLSAKEADKNDSITWYYYPKRPAAKRRYFSVPSVYPVFLFTSSYCIRKFFHTFLYMSGLCSEIFRLNIARGSWNTGNTPIKKK